jgi:ectoine hydroxylase-related dioxygenase (phytanoyl-CoA dioxygenase family)
MTTATLAEPSGLTDSQRRQYEEQGVLIVRCVFSAADIAQARAEAEQLLRRQDLMDTRNLRCRWQPHATSGECLFETFDPVIDLAPVCGRLARAPRLLRLVGDLYGEPARLFKDKLIFKPPGARGYDLHQDYIAWPSFPRSFVTAAVAIDPCGPENGCTIAYRGYHRQGCLSPEDGDYHPLPAETVAVSTALPLELEPGDVALFGCFTPHRSDPNTSDRWRRLLYLSYNADSDGGDRREQHYRVFLDWLRKKYAEYGKTNTYFA